MIVNDFLDPKVLTSILWRHRHMKFSGVCRNHCMEGSSQLSTPLNPNSLFASMLPRTGWAEAPKLTLCPGAGNP